MKNNSGFFTPQKSSGEDRSSPDESVISSLTGSSSDDGGKSSSFRGRNYSGSASKKSANSKDNSRHENASFFRDELFPVGPKNANVKDYNAYFEALPALSEFVKSIVARDLIRIDNSSDPRSNFLRASIVAYTKSETGEIGNFHEVKIGQQFAWDEKSLKQNILRREMEATKARAEELLRQKNKEFIENISDDDQEKLNRLKSLEGLNEKKSFIFGLIRTAMNSEDKSQSVTKNNNKVLTACTAFKKHLREVVNKDYAEIEDLNIIERISADMAERNRENSDIGEGFEQIFSEITQRLTKAFERWGLELEREKSVLERSKKSEKIEKEIQILSDLLDGSELANSELKRVILTQRGHSEDYLYEAISSEGFADFLRQSISPEHNRFFLVATSNRESCSRCSNVMEDIQRILSETVSEDSKVRVLYFSEKPMIVKARDGSVGYVKAYDDTRSYDSEDEKSVTNFLTESFLEVFEGGEKTISSEKAASSDSLKTPERKKSSEVNNEISPPRIFANEGVGNGDGLRYSGGGASPSPVKPMKKLPGRLPSDLFDGDQSPPNSSVKRSSSDNSFSVLQESKSDEKFK